MKYERTSLKMKQAFAEALKNRMKKQTLSQITIQDIAADCNVNRKTFYYHFENLNALLKWMLEQEAIEVVRGYDLLLDYQDAIEFVMGYVKDNTHILNCAYDSIGRAELKRFFYTDFTGITRSVVDSAEKELGVCISENYKAFLIEFFTEALAGMLINCLQGDLSRYDRNEAVAYLCSIINTALPEALKAGSEASAPSPVA